jgi:hypothetical protein
VFIEDNKILSGYACCVILLQQERRSHLMKKLIILLAAVALLIGLGCSGSNPVVPEKDMNSFFNQFNISGPVVGEYNITNSVGEVIASGLLGHDEHGLTFMQDRSSQATVDIRVVGDCDVEVTYNNPQGTMPPGGPNAGLPYYYLGDTINYDVNVTNFGDPIGFTDMPAKMEVEMRYASWDVNGECVPGNLLPGDSIFNWSGIVANGVNVYNDTFKIVPGTTPGLDCTTVYLHWPIQYLPYIDLNMIFWDDCAGIWDPQ